MKETVVCRLPVANRAQRTADFRALFAGTLIDRQRVPGAVRWILRADATTEAESRRLASLEERCCDGVAFEIRRDNDVIQWNITGPRAADPTLDALFDLPVQVASDDGAAALWRTLDAAACGSQSGRKNS
jgi:hypothetical protein